MASSGFLLNLLSLLGKVRQPLSFTLLPFYPQFRKESASKKWGELAETDASSASLSSGEVRAVSAPLAGSEIGFCGAGMTGNVAIQGASPKSDASCKRISRFASR
ncbi:hypothetical protein Pla144_12970 [Bythopirellula polymerisocia]|uniref:Uncharacterized protein n=1 Tax=Bythopirellula polymerisocia TaxID=2528003 RepID=A0A5C6D0V9_9BACT|nr:hypothetical protein Pla144_12970 [Bythopirellula polymerisocia]